MTSKGNKKGLRYTPMAFTEQGVAMLSSEVFATAGAPNLLREELAAAKAYMEKNGTNFRDDLIAFEESSGERRLGA